MPDEEGGGIIIVTGRRPPPTERDMDDGGGGRGGGGGGGPGISGGGGGRDRGGDGGLGQLPTFRDPRPTQPEPNPGVIDKVQPSAGQEDFADDGNPFNDGAAPTNSTVLAWLNALFENVTNPSDAFVFIQDAADPESVFRGSYVLNGDAYTFYSRADGSYGLDYAGSVETRGPDTHFDIDQYDVLF